MQITYNYIPEILKWNMFLRFITLQVFGGLLYGTYNASSPW